MSFVYQNQLKPVNSLELPTFSILIELQNKTLPFKWDAWTLYESYWRTMTIRNFTPDLAIFYRTDDGVFDAIPPNSERTISGWGSLIEIRADGAINGVVDVELVKWSDAQK